jgi:hypothetical protein
MRHSPEVWNKMHELLFRLNNCGYHLGKRYLGEQHTLVDAWNETTILYAPTIEEFYDKLVVYAQDKVTPKPTLAVMDLQLQEDIRALIREELELYEQRKKK